MTHQIGVATEVAYVDKRRSYRNDLETRIVTGPAVFTANAAGTTTTIVGANAAPATNTNTIRTDEEFKLFNGSGSLKEETVFRVTTIAVAASTTVTFTPAAAVATASGDVMKLVGLSNQQSSGDMDRRLVALGFTTAYVAKLTENDKAYQLRISDDPGSL